MLVNEHFVPGPEIEVFSAFIPSFLGRDKEFLYREYIQNGKSMNQIAKEVGCSRSTVGKSITSYGLSRKPGSLRLRSGQLAFGERYMKGRVVAHKQESLIIDEMRSMRDQGASYGEISSWLNEKGIKTKNRVKKWDRPTVYKILSRQNLALSRQ